MSETRKNNEQSSPSPFPDDVVEGVRLPTIEEQRLFHAALRRSVKIIEKGKHAAARLKEIFG